MTQANGTGAVLSVLDEIAAKLATLHPEQLTAPDNDGKKETDIVVGVADDYLKRLHVLHRNEAELVLNNKTELEGLVGELEQAFVGKLKNSATLSALVANMEAIASGDNKQKAERVQELQTTVIAGMEFCNFLGRLFWLEVHKRFPATVGQTSHLRADWSIVIPKPERPRLHEGLFGSPGVFKMGPHGLEEVGEGELPPELLEMVNDMMGDSRDPFEAIFGRRRNSLFGHRRHRGFGSL